MFIWLCDCRQIHLPMPRSQYRTATGTHFKRAGVTLTGLQACVPPFPSPQIKCCFSWLAVAQSLCNVCVCWYMRVCLVVFLWVGGKMACLRDWFATLFDHCKYEFRLFLYRELKWSSIFAQAGSESSSPRGNMRECWMRLGIFFFFFLLRETHVNKEVGGCHLSRWLSAWFATSLFLRDSAATFSARGIFRRTRREGGN